MSQSPSRRAILAAAVATATTAATKIPAQADTCSFSAEYQHCYRAWLDMERTKEIHCRSDITEIEALIERSAYKNWRAAKAALDARPVQSLTDVLALMRVHAWERGHFVRTKDWAVDSDEIRLLGAIEAVVGTAPWLVPEDLRALDEQRRAEEEARHAILRMDYFDVGADV